MGKLYHRGFDDEMRAVVARNLEGRGVNLHPRTSLTEVLYILYDLCTIVLNGIAACFCFLHLIFCVINICPALIFSPLIQVTKTENGVKVTTDHGEEIFADVVLFATGN